MTGKPSSSSGRVGTAVWAKVPPGPGSSLDNEDKDIMSSGALTCTSLAAAGTWAPVCAKGLTVVAAAVGAKGLADAATVCGAKGLAGAAAACVDLGASGARGTGGGIGVDAGVLSNSR